MNPQNQQNQQKSDNHLRSVGNDSSVPTLIRQLAHDATHMFSKEIELAKTEISENINSMKNGLISTATGSFVLYAGVLALLFSAVLGLGTVMPLWLSALIIGAVVTIIGFAMVGAGKKKMEASNLRPDHTIDSVKDNQRAAKGV